MSERRRTSEARILRSARTNRRIACVAVVAALSSAATEPLCAQGTTVLTGRVLDAASGRGIAHAEVQLLGADTITLRADGLGAWRVSPIATGAYRMRLRAVGYLPHAETLDMRLATLAHEARLTAAVLSLDQVVVTAARRAQRLGDAVATTEVVSRADLERTGASDLASVLTEQTGIELQGGHPAGAGVMLQGFGSERVLVLLDGQPIAGRLSGVFDVSRIPVAMVERVEVVKGAQSTLYGSEAMGGVVNIITRIPPRATTTSNLSFTAGTQERRDAALGLSVGRDAIAASIDAGRRSLATTPGVASDAGALAARFDLAAKLRWTPDSARSVEASVLALEERQRWRSGTFFNFGDNLQASARVGASFVRGRHRFAPAAWMSIWDHRSRASTAPMPVAGDTGQRQLQRVRQFELLYNGRFSERFALDAGTQVRIDGIDAARVAGGARSNTTFEPFAQLEVSPTRALTVLPGVRLSRSSQWGTQLTPRVAARARLSDRLTLRASFGEGFRAPDFKELHLFFQNTTADYAVQGNPDLRPESSRNAMLGAEMATATGYVRAQLFHNAFRDFIETRVITAPTEPPVYQYANIADGTTQGLEVEAGANLTRFAALRVEGSISMLDTHDRATGGALLGRPASAARATLAATPGLGLRTTLTALHTGRTPMSRDERTGSTTSHRDAFTRLDVRIARALPLAGVEFALGADNLFDRRPAEWAGFTARHVYTTLTWTFNRPTDR